MRSGKCRGAERGGAGSTRCAECGDEECGVRSVEDAEWEVRGCGVRGCSRYKVCEVQGIGVCALRGSVCKRCGVQGASVCRVRVCAGCAGCAVAELLIRRS